MKLLVAISLCLAFYVGLPPLTIADGNTPGRDYLSNYYLENSGQASPSSLLRELEKLNGFVKKVSDKNDTAQWFAGLVALVLGLAGVFDLPGFVRRWFYERPDVDVSIKLSPPDSLKVPVTNSVTGQTVYETYYLRFRIENSGNSKLEGVEVIALELYKKGRNNRYKRVNQFLPMNLKWSNFGELVMPAIPRHLYKHCDLGHIIENPNPEPNQNRLLQMFGMLGVSNDILILDTQVTPNTGSNYLLPGEYKLRIVVTADGLEPKYYWFKIFVAGAWSANERIMFTSNLRIERTR